jgi:hypothetical protein
LVNKKKLSVSSVAGGGFSGCPGDAALLTDSGIDTHLSGVHTILRINTIFPEYGKDP